MAAQFLFDSNGICLAFRVGQYVFNTNGSWIGWLPWNDEDVVTPEGKYLGTIVKGNRFDYCNKPERASSDYPSDPGYPDHVGYPLLPLGAQDVKFPK